MFVIGTDTFLISPLLPLLQQTFHIKAGQAGWMVSSYALGYALFALIAGPLSDRLNRKKVMLGGLAAFAISTALCASAYSFSSMNIFRFAAGVSAAFVTPQVWASIPTLFPKDKILRAMGIATAGLSISQLLGLPLGSYLAAINWRIPFLVIGFLALLLVGAVWSVFPNILPEEQRTYISNPRSLLKPYLQLLRSPKAALAFTAYFLFQFGNFAAFSFLGSWLSVSYRLDVSEIGGVMLFLGLGNTIGSIWGTSLVGRIGAKNALLIGVMFNALLYILLASVSNLTVVKAGLFFIFSIGGTLFPVMISSLQTLSSTARGTIAALTNTLMYLGTTLGAAAAGELFEATGSFLSIAILTFISLMLFLVIFTISGVLPKRIKQQA
ncbi:MFS transporter [Paenibacillus sp. SN-8-1]|uniref:MFS transporter n=1 Tax=Paenibacillus sp. SN-8-1 TaxID=3435409 RepID=UPI003D9A8268